MSCLLYGWLDVFSALESPASIDSFGRAAWLANPLALVAAVLLIARRSAGAAVFGAASIVVAMLYLLDPPGRHLDVPRVGALLWLCSFVALTIAAVVRRGGSLARKHAEPGAAAVGGA